MRIVDRETFLAMPSGTVYAKYRPCAFDELTIKGETTAGIDWYAMPLNGPWFQGVIDSASFFDRLDSVQGGKPSGRIEYAESRDGLFEYDQLFAVWEKDDLVTIIQLLVAALSEGYEQ